MNSEQHGWSGDGPMDISPEWRGIFAELFPELHEHLNFELTSEIDYNYNCLSWALSYSDKYLDNGKGCYWPWKNIPEDTANGWAEVCRLHGFESIPIQNTQFVPGIEKVAILANEEGDLHATRQSPNGWWKSKLGTGPDIDHSTLDSIKIPYGNVVHLLQRVRNDWL
jgi:hypothetical protein